MVEKYTVARLWGTKILLVLESGAAEVVFNADNIFTDLWATISLFI